MIENVLVPDSITPVVGWRMWRLTDDGLVSINNRWMWQPRETSSAQCFKSDLSYSLVFWTTTPRFNSRPPHRAPLQECTCGFYAARERWRATAYKGDVIGRLALWGKVIEYDGGWRGERGYPQAFYTDVTDRRDVLERYGIPILSTSDLPPEERPKCLVCAEPIRGEIVSAEGQYPACGPCAATKYREALEAQYQAYFYSPGPSPQQSLPSVVAKFRSCVLGR